LFSFHAMDLSALQDADPAESDDDDMSNHSEQSQDEPTDPNAGSDPVPSAESRSSNPNPNPPRADLSLSRLAPAPDDSNPSKASLISPDLRTDDDFSDEDDLDVNHNRSGTMSYNQRDIHDHDEAEAYDNFDDDDDGLAAFQRASHRRTGSMAERQEQLAKQKEAMERKLRSLSQNLDQGLDDALNEFQEMERINADKQIFSDLFDRIDPQENGDVDQSEWIEGLQRMNVDILDSDMAKIFKLMDNDKSGYIDRQDWITFCMQQYENKELQRLHDSVLANVKGHSRRPSNMIHAQDADHWSDRAIVNLEKQMTKALIVQGTAEMEKAEEEEEYIADIQNQAEQDPNWAKPERAMKWSPKEVAFWLDSIELSQYARKFDEEACDGSMLLNDLDKVMLSQDMGIKNLHVGKILREVDKLRKLNKDELQESYKDWNELIEDNKQLSERLFKANQDIKELEAKNAELRLKTINAANPALMLNPMMDDEPPELVGGGDTTKGLEEEYDKFADGLLTETESKDSGMVHQMQEEIERLTKEKIKFAENAAEEICNLNRIIRALSTEYTTLTTPYFQRFEFNPVDSIIRSLGYQPAQQQ